jgi:hypothetical protein
MILKKFKTTTNVVILLIFINVTAYSDNKNLKAIDFKVSVPYSKNLKKHYDNHPSKITKKDIKVLKKLNDIAYNLSEENYKEIRVDLIYRLIVSHKVHKSEYNKLKINGVIMTGLRTDPYSDNTDPNEENQFYRAYVKLSYPLWDDKTETKIHNDKLKYNLTLIDKIREYADNYNLMQEAEGEVKFLRMKQRVWKGEELTGVKYRDQLLELHDTLRLANVKLRKSRAIVRSLKLYLLNLTTQPRELLKLL